MTQPPSTAAPTKFSVREEERWTVDETADFYAVHNGDFTIATLDFVRWRPEQAKAYAHLIAAAPETAAERDRLLKMNERLLALLQDAQTHVEKMADVLATGPVAGPVEHLANDIAAVLSEAHKP